MRGLLLVALLLAPLPALADPGTIAFILAASVEIGTLVITVKTLLVVGLYVYGTAHARRKARKAQAAARASYNANLQDRSVTALQALPPWRVVYGRCLTGGDVHAIFTSDKTGYREDGSTYTKPDALKHLVIVFADHEVQAIQEVYLDGAPCGALDGSGFVTSGEFFSSRVDTRTATVGGGGTVTVGQAVVTVLNAYTDVGAGSQNSNPIDVAGSISLTSGNTVINGPVGAVVNYTVQSNLPSVRIQKHLGTSSQAVDTYLNSVAASEWTSTDRLLNKAYIVLTLDLENQRFQGGPPGVTADISGRKVYDPRKDSTVSGGSGSHRTATPSTWEWSDNNALHIRDYLTAEWGFESAHVDVNDAFTIAAANACDARSSATAQSKADTVTASASSDQITFTTDQQYGVGDGVRFTTTGTLPGGLSLATTYYLIRNTDSRSFQLASSVANAYAGTAINITSAGTGTHTCTWHDYATFKCNGAFTTEDAGKEAILDDLAESMAGNAVYGAQWEILAGAWTSTVMDLTDDDLVGQIELVQADVGMDQLLNGVRGTYIPAGKAVPQEFDNYTNSTFVSADGRELWDDRALPFTDHKARARNLCRIFVERGRNGQLLRYPAKLKAWPLQRGDRVRVSSTEYGLSLKAYRVTDWQFGVTSPVVLTLQEDDSTVYDLSDAATADPTTNTNLPSPWVVQAITLGTPTSGAGVGYVNTDGSWVPRIKVTWTAVTDAYLANGEGRIVISWRTPRDGTAWQRMEVLSNETSAYLEGAREADPVIIEVVARNGLQQFGPSSFVSHTVAVTGNGVVGGGNLLRNSDFEVDSNADGLADNWVTYSSGTTGTLTFSLVSGGVGGGKYQNLAVTNLGTTAGDQAGLYQVVELEGLAGLAMTWSPYVYGLGAGAGTINVRLYIDWYNAAGGTGSIISSSQRLLDRPPVGWGRYALSATIPAGTLSARVYVWMESRGGGAGSTAMIVDKGQFEIGIQTAYAPRADELLAGVVGTTQIADGAATTGKLATNAATEIVSDSGSVGYSFTDTGAGFQWRVQRLQQISWTNSTSATITVELSAEIQGTRSAGAGSVYLDVNQQFSSAMTSNSFSSVGADTLHTDATSGYRRYTYTNQADVSAGSTIYLATTAIINTAASTTTDYSGDARLRIVVIKR